MTGTALITAFHVLAPYTRQDALGYDPISETIHIMIRDGVELTEKENNTLNSLGLIRHEDGLYGVSYELP